MWNKGDVVIYGANGICRIDDFRDEPLGNEIKRYCILKPVFDEKNTYFVPTFNESLMGKIYPVLSKDDMLVLINKSAEIIPEWIDNDKLRQETYHKVLESGERERIISVIKALEDRKNTLLQNGKKFRTSDDILLNKAKRILDGEIAFIFEISPETVHSFIEQLISNI